MVIKTTHTFHTCTTMSGLPLDCPFSAPQVLTSAPYVCNVKLVCKNTISLLVYLISAHFAKSNLYPFSPLDCVTFTCVHTEPISSHNVHDIPATYQRRQHSRGPNPSSSPCSWQICSPGMSNEPCHGVDGALGVQDILDSPTDHRHSFGCSSTWLRKDSGTLIA